MKRGRSQQEIAGNALTRRKKKQGFDGNKFIGVHSKLSHTLREVEDALHQFSKPHSTSLFQGEVSSEWESKLVGFTYGTPTRADAK